MCVKSCCCCLVFALFTIHKVNNNTRYTCVLTGTKTKRKRSGQKTVGFYVIPMIHANAERKKIKMKKIIREYTDGDDIYTESSTKKKLAQKS